MDNLYIVYILVGIIITAFIVLYLQNKFKDKDKKSDEDIMNRYEKCKHCELGVCKRKELLYSKESVFDGFSDYLEFIKNCDCTNNYKDIN